MKYSKIPHTDIKVSKICLGTMTWGNQNTEAEGHEQMEYAFGQGVNFFDTAELYPVPATEETYAETERIIGTWFKKSGNRDKVVLATKIAGPGDYTAHIRKNGFKPEAIKDAVEKSLKRLQTDYIDLYQLHWPERQANFFGTRDYKHDPSDPWKDNFHETLSTLDALIKEGKIRHVGISNETPWGTMRYLEESKKGLPRMVTIQNAYSLVCRSFETSLSEIAMRENIGLLAYSPLGCGVLSGKYLDGKLPADSRLALFPRFARYSGKEAMEATQQYNEVAKKHNISLSQMALAFINQQPFLTGNIIGATKIEQLKENIASIDLDLSQEIIDEINEIHSSIPNPAP